MTRHKRYSAEPTEGPRAHLIALRSAVRAAQPAAGRRRAIGTEQGTGLPLTRFDTRALAPLLGAAFLMRSGASEGTAMQFLDDMEDIGGLSVLTRIIGHQRSSLAVTLRVARPTRRPTGISILAQWNGHDDSFTDLKAHAELITGLPSYEDSAPSPTARVLIASETAVRQLNMETDRGVDHDVAMAIGLVVATTSVVAELLPAMADV